MNRLLVCGGTVALLSSLALATPTVAVGNKILAPNLPGQPVQLQVTGGDAVQGADLNVEVADGGAAGGGSIAGPSISSANLVSGTIFAPNNSGQQNIFQLPQVFDASVVTNTGTVNAAGLFATLTIDTTGFSTPGQSFALRLKGFGNGVYSGDSDFVGNTDEGVIPSNITNGNIIITLPQDLNLDGAVGFADLLTLAQNYGRTSGVTPLQGDINRDGAVNFNDLLSLAQNYGQSINTNLPAPAVAALGSVPEPAALGVVAIGAVALVRRRR